MIMPFTSLVGQEDMKLGLILNVVDPSIGGLLIIGEKGTGKSTAVRALADLLPEYDVSRGCRFNCDPDGKLLCSTCADRLSRSGSLDRESARMRVVELPLGVTEDRLIGTLDVEYALQRGQKRFEPGILADANRNFLYVDEVNLLEDHIVDLLLDSAAMGRNVVEREGVSFVHPARFFLVGTMNPEEGDLRPQLLDRFGLCVYVRSIRDRELRIEILRRRADFDLDPGAFAAKWESAERELSDRINEAKRLLPEVKVSEKTLSLVVSITTSVNVDGHRPDIVILKAARAHAALFGREEAALEDIRMVALLGLSHRLKRLPFEDVGSERRRLEDTLSQAG